MKKPKLLLKVKMQTIFNFQTLTRLISIGLLIAIVSPSNIAFALKVESVPSPQLNKVVGLQIRQMFLAQKRKQK